MTKGSLKDVYQFGIRKYKFINDLIDRNHINYLDQEEVDYAENAWRKMKNIPTGYIWYFWYLYQKKGNRKHYLEGCLKYDVKRMQSPSNVRKWLKEYD